MPAVLKESCVVTYEFRRTYGHTVRFKIQLKTHVAQWHILWSKRKVCIVERALRAKKVFDTRNRSFKNRQFLFIFAICSEFAFQEICLQAKDCSHVRGCNEHDLFFKGEADREKKRCKNVLSA